jgi:hypothetical protein
MSLTESVNGWRSNSTIKANDTLTSNQWRNATFPASTPTGYSKAWQNLTVTGLTATPDVRTVQYGTSFNHVVTIGSTSGQLPAWLSQAAQRFTVPDTVNLTSIWLYYSSSSSWNNPVQILSQSANVTTPSAASATQVGSGVALGSLSGGSYGWYNVPLVKNVTLSPSNYYWVVVNGTGILSTQNFYWGAKFDSGDNKYASGMDYGSTSWLDEATLATTQGWSSTSFNFMLMLVVLPVNPSNVKQVRTYSSPAQVGMELNGTLPITSNRTSIPAAYNTLVLNTNTSVSFAANWTARFYYPQPTTVSTHYISRNGYTLWNASFPVGAKPTNSYTWYNLTFEVTNIPQYWSSTKPPINVTNSLGYSYVFKSGSQYYILNETNPINTQPWSNEWTIATKSTYKVTASLPSQIMEGLRFALNVSTKPYSASWCNVSFYNGNIQSFSRNVSIPSTSTLVTLSLNDTGLHTLFLYDRWTGGNEASLNNTLTINVLQISCNVTATDRMSPVIGNTGWLRFKFYNNSLGTGNTKIQPLAVSINSTLDTNFVYNTASGNTTVYVSTATAGWHTGNNTIMVSAKSGLFNATTRTWIMVLQPLCNITVVGRTSAVIGNDVGFTFKFYNTSLGSGVSMQPSSVSVNATLTSFTNGPGGNTSVVLVTTSATWHTGNNTLIVSAEKGAFNATLKTWIMVQVPLCHLSVTSTRQLLPRTNMTISFQFRNDTPGAASPYIGPTSVEINSTSTSFTYSGENVTTTWGILRGGWSLGLNYANISATNGYFTNFTIEAINVVSPLCNVTVKSINSPILGDYAEAQFMFLNGTSGWTPMNMTNIEVNGTSPNLYYAGSNVWTVSWLTSPINGWQPGQTNYANITAFNGVYYNFTVEPFFIITPIAQITVNSTNYPAVYGDLVSVGFTFLNTTTHSAPQRFPSAIDLYVNGSLTSPTVDFLNGSYAYAFETWSLPQAGSYILNFTAVYGTYTASHMVPIVVSKITLTLTLRLGESSVTAGSSLSASATLRYANNTPVEDLTPVIFEFTATYANGTIRSFNVTSVTAGGSCSASFVTSGDMKKIDVEAIYLGDGIRSATSKSAPSVDVTPPTSGFSIGMLVVTTAGGALAVIAVAAVAITRRRAREKEYKKTAALRQTASLAQLLVVHLASGRCLFSRTIGSEEGADPNLVSGFLSANQSLINEVFKNKTAGLRFADYGEYKVISDVGKHVMATLFATETAGEELKDTLRSFTADFEKKFGKTLETWDGDMKAFDGADEIADEVFCLPLTAPYMLIEDESARLGKEERLAVHSAKIISAERGIFFMPRVIDYLLTKQGIKRAKAMDVIDSLQKKGIFRQLTMDQAAQVIKSFTEKAGTQS